MTAKDIYESVCMIHSQGYEEGGCGTGFFIRYQNDYYICTNRHVIYNPKSNRKQLTLFYSAIHTSTNQIVIGKTNCPLDKLQIISSDEYDVAIFSIHTLMEDLRNKSYRLNHYFISEHDVISQYNNFEYIEDVVIAGYPNQFKDAYTNRPILASGITATPLPLTLERKDEFLLNITTYHSNSGSPIFIKKENSYQLIGILRGSLIARITDKNVNINNNYFIKEVDKDEETAYAHCIKSNVLMSLLQKTNTTSK